MKKAMQRRSGSVPCLQRVPLESTPDKINNLTQQSKILQSSTSNIPKLVARQRRASVSDPCNPTTACGSAQSAFKALKIQQPVCVLRQSLENLSRNLNLSLETISMLSREEIYRRMEVEYEAMKKVASPNTAIVSPFLVSTNKEDDEVENYMGSKDSVFSTKSPESRPSSSQSSMNKSLSMPRTPSSHNRYARSMSVALVQECNVRRSRKTSVDFRYNAPLTTGRSAFIKSNRPMSAKPSLTE